MNAAIAAFARSAAHTLILTAVLLVCGLVTRPLALASDLYAFHAVLMALPSACALASFLHATGNAIACASAVCLFAAVLGAMSPVMGLAALVPLMPTGLVWVLARRTSPRNRARAAGFAYGALYYPCTVGLSSLGGALALVPDGSVVAKLLLSVVLGAALSGLGAFLSPERLHGGEGS